MTTAPACLFYQILTSQFWTFIYLTLARLVGSERYFICEKQANIGQVTVTVTRNNSRKWPRVFFNAIPQNYQMPHGLLVLEGLTAHVTTVACPGGACMQIQVRLI